jgi:hypothetical protein
MKHDFINIINKIMHNNCDCCYKENVYVVKCSSNNKCEYSMCNTCLENLKIKTKTNLCPACREEKVEIIIDNTPPELQRTNHFQQINQSHNCIKDSFKILCSPFYVICYFGFNILKFIYDFTQFLFCLYNIRNNKLRIGITIFLSFVLIIFFFILSRLIYNLIFPRSPFWCNTECMILTSIPAIVLLLCFFLLIFFIIISIIYCMGTLCSIECYDIYE